MLLMRSTRASCNIGETLWTAAQTLSGQWKQKTTLDSLPRPAPHVARSPMCSLRGLTASAKDNPLTPPTAAQSPGSKPRRADVSATLPSWANIQAT